MSEDINVTGLSDLQEFLDQLTPKVERNVMRGALRAGMMVVLPAARQGIHSVSGELAAGLKVGTRAQGGLVTANIKATGPHAFVAKWVEYGTKAHFIGGQPGHGLRFPDGQIVEGVVHPGAAPHPFMRPALDGQASSAVVAAAEYMKERLATKEGLDTSDISIEADQ